MDMGVFAVEQLVSSALKLARFVDKPLGIGASSDCDPPTPPGYWNVVIVLLEEIQTVLLEKPEGRHGDNTDLPF